MIKILLITVGVGAFLFLATYRLWLLPLLCKHCGSKTVYGTVVEMRKFRAGITIIIVKEGIPGGRIEEKGGGFSDVYVIVGQIHTRRSDNLPNKQDYVKVTTNTIYYRLASRAVDWLTRWEKEPVKVNRKNGAEDRGWGKRKLTIS